MSAAVVSRGGRRGPHRRRAARAFHLDDCGEEVVNKLLILALLALPIVILLVLFGGKIMGELKVAACELGLLDLPETVDVEKFPAGGPPASVGREGDLAPRCWWYRYGGR